MAQITRRSFLRGAVALGAGAVLHRFGNGGYRLLLAADGPVTYRLRIIHTNDHHARIEPANVTIQSTPSTVTRNFGGVARRKTLFDQIRADDSITPNKLFLDAGDFFQGTLYFNQYLGYADLDFYRQLGYDAVAIGNHEFDRGDQPLADFITGATTGTHPNPPLGLPGALGGSNFPVLSANIAAAAGPLAGKIQPNTTKVVGGKKIGIFSLTTPDTPILSSPSANVSFVSDLVAVAQAQIDALRTAEACDIVIALTHIGYALDQNLASQVRGLNAIVGGHSHTPLVDDASAALPLGIAPQGPYPTVVQDLDGKDVIVVTDWEWGKWVGDLTLSFNSANEVVAAESDGAVIPVWADGLGTRAPLPGEGDAIAADAAFQAQITDVYKPPIAALQATKIGATAVRLLGDRADVRSRETNLGNLVADVLRARILAAADNDPARPVVAITNGGGIRASINAGDVTVGNVLEVLPFGNTIAYVNLSGVQLLAALENGVSQVESGAGRFPQVSGLRFTWNPAAAPGRRIGRVLVLEGDSYQPLDFTKVYRVATNNFMLTGGDGYAVFTQGQNAVDSGLIMADEVQAAITALSENGDNPLNVGTDARILRLQALLPQVHRPAVPAAANA